MGVTLRALGYEVCAHPAQRIRKGRTRANCQICGALKTAQGWLGGSVDHEFDVEAVRKLHGRRVNAENTN